MEQEEKNLGGRPLTFETPESLILEIKKYFDQFRDKKTIKLLGELRPTISGLCFYLGFESRQSFYDYEKKEGFSYTIKRARLLIENVYENMLGTSSTTGAIFALKNFDWHDKAEIDHTNNGEKFDPPITYVKRYSDKPDDGAV